MRDLANQSIIRRRRVSPKTSGLFIIITVLVFLIMVVSWKLNGLTTSSGGDSAYLKDAPKGLTPVKVDGAAIEADAGLNVSTGGITLSDVKYGGTANGTASRTFGAGTYSLSVTATLPDTKGGDRYQVWLSNGSGVFDAGFMNGSKTSWSLVFNDKDKYSSYKSVWVTREITTEDGKPEQKVLVGSF